MQNFIIFICALILLGSCEKRYGDYTDRYNSMSREDFKTGLQTGEKDLAPPKEERVAATKIDDISPILLQPQKPKVRSDKLVTITVTEDVPIKDVLIELARMADIDVQIANNVSGGVNLKVKDKPLNEVIEIISKNAGLRFEVENNVLKVEKDTTYLVNYPVDFLNFSRVNTGEITVKVALGSDNSSSSGGGNSNSNSNSNSSSNSGIGGGVNSGSETKIKTVQEGDLWKSVEESIGKIIGIPSVAQLEANTSVNNNQDQQPQALETKKDEEEKPYITLNKQAGIITVSANSQSHHNVRSYLAKVLNSISSQALIEAKIVEIELNDDYRTGVNWSVLDRKFGGLKGDFLTSPSEDVSPGQSFFFGALNKLGRVSGSGPSQIPSDNSAANLTGLVSMMQLFGTTRTLSSPRIHAMNNQQAVLSFAKNHVYFTLNVTTTVTSSQGNNNTSLPQTDVNSQINTVPIGIILTLQPSINAETSEITMNVRPTISRIVDETVDPAIAFAIRSLPSDVQKTINSKVPVVEVKELDSILKIKSGGVMVIGGMMENRSNNVDNGIPFIDNVPIAGNLFKSVAKTDRIVQTVIFIKATIVPGVNISEDDRRFYNNFANKELNPLKI
jgi:MSHA biogenesis protein MshL